MSPAPLAVGVVGTSWWADAMHLPALAAHPGAQVVAICGRNRERADAAALRWQIPRFYTDVEQMLEREALDALIVATRNDSHHPIAMGAIERGVHVLCEKPLALNYAEALQMERAARHYGINTMIPFTYRYMPAVRYLKQLMDEGYLGRPYHLNMRYYTGFGRSGDSYHWRFDLGRAGAGVVGDLGSHFLYLAEWFYGEIVAVSARLGRLVPRPARNELGESYEAGDDLAFLTLEFLNGAMGSIHVSSLAYEETPFGQSHQMEFHGSEGTLYHRSDWDREQRVAGARVGEGAVRELPIPETIWGDLRRDTVHNTYRDTFRRTDVMTRGFISDILAGRASEPDFGVGAHIQRVIEAAQRSDREGRRVAVSEIDG